MDYKFLILLILLLGVIFLITKEMNKMRGEFEERNTQIMSIIDNSNKSIKNKIQNDVGLCISKIKTYNSEYIQQIRKMDALGSQPITNMSNHYTDSVDSEKSKDNKKKLQYLSDVRADNKNVTQNESCHLYMSDASPLDGKNLPKLNRTKEKRDDSSRHFVIELGNEIEQKDISSPAKVIQSTALQNDQKENNNSPKIKNSEKMADTKSNNSKSEKESRSEKSSHSKNVEYIDESSSEHDEDEEESMSNMSTSNMSDISVSMAQTNELSDISSGEDETEVDITDKLNMAKNPINTQQKKQPTEEDFEGITVGSSKGGKKGVKPSITISKQKKKIVQKITPEEDKEEDKENEPNDNMSVATTDINIMTTDKLKSADMYKIDALRKMAKMYSIPVSCKEGNGRRQLAKNELYNKIKEYLSDKKKSH